MSCIDFDLFLYCFVSPERLNNLLGDGFFFCIKPLFMACSILSLYPEPAVLLIVSLN